MTVEMYPRPMIYEFDKRLDILDITDQYTEVGNLVTSDLPAGTYEWKLSITYTFDTTSVSAFIQFRIDGGQWYTFSREPKDSNDTYALTYFFPQELTAGSHQFEVQMRKGSAANQLDVAFADTIIQRVG